MRPNQGYKMGPNHRAAVDAVTPGPGGTAHAMKVRPTSTVKEAIPPAEFASTRSIAKKFYATSRILLLAQ